MIRREPLLYAGYGANRDPNMVEAIIGQVPKFLGDIAIRDVELCVQRIDQTPATVAPDSPAPLSVRQILEDPGNWGPNSDFETYTIRRKHGGVVAGSLFELTDEQRALIAEWEMIEFGWYQRMRVTAYTATSLSMLAETEGLGDGQSIDRTVDGLKYATYLNDSRQMHAMAQKTRQEYFERQAQGS